MDWWKQQFGQLIDTAILFLALVASVGLVLHLAHHSMDQGLMSWAQNICSGFAGALLLRLNRKTDDKPGNSNETSNTSTRT